MEIIQEEARSSKGRRDRIFAPGGGCCAEDQRWSAARGPGVRWAQKRAERAAARDGRSTSGDVWVCGAYFVHGLSATGGTNDDEPTKEKAG